MLVLIHDLTFSRLKKYRPAPGVSNYSVFAGAVGGRILHRKNPCKCRNHNHTTTLLIRKPPDIPLYRNVKNTGTTIIYTALRLCVSDFN